MRKEDSTPVAVETARRQWDRAEVAQGLADSEAAAASGQSRRSFAAEVGVAPSPQALASAEGSAGRGSRVGRGRLRYHCPNRRLKPLPFRQVLL